MPGLTQEELIDIVVALDNEAASCDTEDRAKELRALKWKVFALSIDAPKKGG